jgi:hypothetical protein
MNTRSILVMVFVGACVLLSACCTEASAEGNIGFKAIGLKVGYVDPEGDLDGTVEFGAQAEFGEFVKQLHWDGSISYWSTGRDYPYGGHSYSWKLSDLIFRTGVGYDFLRGPWEPYVGGGLGLHFYSWDYAGAPNYSNASDTKFGLYIEGGIEHEFNERWTGELQLQFDFADPDQTALLFHLLYNLTPTSN